MNHFGDREMIDAIDGIDGVRDLIRAAWAVGKVAP